MFSICISECIIPNSLEKDVWMNFYSPTSKSTIYLCNVVIDKRDVLDLLSIWATFLQLRGLNLGK